jgi:hypothetical protein
MQPFHCFRRQGLHWKGTSVVVVKVILVLRVSDRCLQLQLAGVRSRQNLAYSVFTLQKDDATRLKSIDVRLGSCEVVKLGCRYTYRQ